MWLCVDVDSVEERGSVWLQYYLLGLGSPSSLHLIPWFSERAGGREQSAESDLATELRWQNNKMLWQIPRHHSSLLYLQSDVRSHGSRYSSTSCCRLYHTQVSSDLVSPPRHKLTFLSLSGTKLLLRIFLILRGGLDENEKTNLMLKALILW